MTETTILKQQIANLALELRQIGDSVTAAKLEDILDEYRRNSADARKTRRKKIRCPADSPPDMSAGPSSSPSLKERNERKNQREIKRENTPTPNTDDDGDAAADLVSVVRKYASKHSLNAAAVEGCRDLAETAAALDRLIDIAERFGWSIAPAWWRKVPQKNTAYFINRLKVNAEERNASLRETPRA